MHAMFTRIPVAAAPGESSAAFAATLVAWQRTHGRNDLPWQLSRDPYRVWLSEIMLQQTQVGAVIPYYHRFLAQLPTLHALARADGAQVLGLWSGLGYYARARNLHRAAQIVMDEHGGHFPQSAAAIATLPGIGRSTAAAIAAFCFGERAAILDGNVKRVLARHFGIDGFPGSAPVERRLWALAEKLLPNRDIDAYTQALMDLGATVCTRAAPACRSCPVSDGCVALRDDRIGQLPTPRPRREIHVRRATLLLPRAGDGSIWLARRPPSGVWGGLLAPAELPEGEDAHDWSTRSLGLRVERIVALPPLTHSFTHFTLHAQPLLCDLAAPRGLRVAEPDGAWIALDALAPLPLPAPIRRLLHTLPAAR